MELFKLRAGFPDGMVVTLHGRLGLRLTVAHGALRGAGQIAIHVQLNPDATGRF